MSQPLPPTGLTAAEVAARLARGEGNRAPRSDLADYLALLARNVLTLFNALVVPAALALYWLREYRDALAVSGMALTNLVLGLAQEVRAKRHLDRLTLLGEARARVVRDGQVREVPAGDVVKDDLLLLAAGDAVVADGPVEEAHFLEVDEALLTGESDPVPRRPGDALLSGSFCAAGEGAYRAEGVGAASFAQRTSAAARVYRPDASPVEAAIDRLLAILGALAVVLCAGYGGLYLLGAVGVRDLVQMVAATITSMVPQGLVLMATLAFVLGAVRLSRRGALVRRLSAVESMASVDTLCLDKTGTLTTGRLHLERLRVLDETIPEQEVRQRLRRFASASPDRGNKSLAALRDALGEEPIEPIDQLPFKSQNRYSAVRIRRASGGTGVPPVGEGRTGGRPVPPDEHVLALGAWEALRPYLRAAEAGESAWRELLVTGLRVLLFAEAEAPPDRAFAGSLEGFVLRPLALIGLGDELRPEARPVLEELAAQGVRFKVLSGDHADTVRAAVAPLAEAAALDALARTPVISGEELQDAADADELIRTGCVFGRVAPAQKVQIVKALKKQGHHVAMLGDGVNDVLPIKEADVGVALGDGARACKTVAAVVLETNDFGLLPRTFDEGRIILRNLRRAGKLFLTKNVFTLVLIVGAVGAFGLPFPYLPRQVTLLNFLTIGVPALVVMLGRRRFAGAPATSFLRDVGWFAIRTGIVLGAAGLLLLGLSNRVWGDDEATQRTLLLSLLIVLGLTTMLRAVGDGGGGPRTGDRRFLLLAAAAQLVYLGVLYWRPVGEWFALTPLRAAQWAWVLAFAGVAWAVLAASDRMRCSRLGSATKKAGPHG